MEIDITIHEEIAGMIVQKYNDGISNIILIWAYLVREGKVAYLLQKSTKVLRSKSIVKEYNENNIYFVRD